MSVNEEGNCMLFGKSIPRKSYLSFRIEQETNLVLFLVKYENTEEMMVYVIYKALCFDVAQGRMNGAPNETRTHSCRSASLAC